MDVILSSVLEGFVEFVAFQAIAQLWPKDADMRHHHVPKPGHAAFEAGKKRVGCTGTQAAFPNKLWTARTRNKNLHDPTSHLQRLLEVGRGRGKLFESWSSHVLEPGGPLALVGLTGVVIGLHRWGVVGESDAANTSIRDFSRTQFPTSRRPKPRNSSSPTRDFCP